MHNYMTVLYGCEVKKKCGKRKSLENIAWIRLFNTSEQHIEAKYVIQSGVASYSNQNMQALPLQVCAHNDQQSLTPHYILMTGRNFDGTDSPRCNDPGK